VERAPFTERLTTLTSTPSSPSAPMSHGRLVYVESVITVTACLLARLVSHPQPASIALLSASCPCMPLSLPIRAELLPLLVTPMPVNPMFIPARVALKRGIVQTLSALTVLGDASCTLAPLLPSILPVVPALLQIGRQEGSSDTVTMGLAVDTLIMLKGLIVRLGTDCLVSASATQNRS
ncbi:hypothetical protein KIPB_014643, partial [Kipferlia bialata]